MTRSTAPIRRVLIALTAFFSLSAIHAHAQVGVCSNPAITSAIKTALRRSPTGAGTAGDCNPANYGGGSWSSQADLVKRVGAASYCSSPWIGQIYLEVYNRFPNNDECDANHYAPWTSYMDLTGKVQAFKSGRATAAVPAPAAIKLPAAGQFLVAANGSLIDSKGTVVAAPGSYLVASGGGNLIPQDGAGVVQPTPGMLITDNGGGMRTIQSVGGKRVIKATILRR